MKLILKFTMGFNIVENILIPDFGIYLSNCYVTIKGSYFYGKKQENIYYLSSNWSMYANQASSHALKNGNISIDISDPEADYFVTLYNAIKQEFPNNTFIDN
jgi:hypothetical protein